MPDLPKNHALPQFKSTHVDEVSQWGQGRGGRPWERKRERVFVRDRYLCQSCKRRGLYTYVTLHGINHGICDHIVPIAEGGSDLLDNLQTLCQACSREKTQQESGRGKTVDDEWIDIPPFLRKQENPD